VSFADTDLFPKSLVRMSIAPKNRRA